MVKRNEICQSACFDAVSAAMGNVVYIATFDTEDELNGFIKDMVASY